MIKVLIAEDHDLIRGALIALLSEERDIRVVEEVSRGDEIVPAVVGSRPDVALLDIGLPGIDGLEAAGLIKELEEPPPVLILTSVGSPGNFERAMAAGVRGFLVKDAPAHRLTDAIRVVARGERYIDLDVAADGGEQKIDGNPLTTREVTVLSALAAGGSGNDLRSTLGLSVHTIRNYLAAARLKTGARSDEEAVRIARANGWLAEGPIAAGG
ncbi:DNA-binding response regulator [Sphaerisporangium melleum]|uniref:DNA-binding response regulator n=1 Tax=Sphaerisporangium melleum TaxID=321316 RepID=A0A917RAV3_9ACTN|nr:response regulator transcription factor [Sphaerisporangium melleum]GGK97863.1 DNA-binding response regulator [Sphaerisporangium melleum]GII73671.1 DNA-binding response regulator [Sphaerisporangium melleum]